MLMMRSNAKLTPPPPVPPRPSKTVVAEALAKSRKLSPVRALYATQPLSAVNIKNNDKPVVPVRIAPPPPTTKPRPISGQIAQPQVVKSFSSAMVFSPKLRATPDVVRSISDCGDETPQGKSRTVVFQSSNIKTSKIDVKLSRKPSLTKNGDLKKYIVESTKNERNKEVPVNKCDEKQTIKITSQEVETPVIKTENRHCFKINTTVSDKTQPTTNNKDSDKLQTRKKSVDKLIVNKELDKVSSNSIKDLNASKSNKDIVSKTDKEMNEAEKLDLNHSETIVQSCDKTMIIVTDDANNNTFQNNNKDTDASIPNASKHETESNTDGSSKDSTGERKKVQFDDKVNHEILIAELQSMREEQDRLLKRQRKPPVDIYDNDNDSVYSDRSSTSRIQHSDWVEVANNGEEVRLSSCQIYIESEDSKSSSLSSRKSASRVPSMSSLHGLPPLPKSLSGFNLMEAGHRSIETPRGTYRVPASPGPQTPSRAGSSRGPTPPTPGSVTGHVVYPPHPARANGTTELPRGRKITTLDTQLAVLRREMYGLRQLDLSLLSQLYSLNEAIQDFRQILQDQEDCALSPGSPSISSGDEGDEFYSPAPVRYKPPPPAPPLRRTSNSSSANSSEYGTV